jgi:hypothetical protein
MTIASLDKASLPHKRLAISEYTVPASGASPVIIGSSAMPLRDVAAYTLEDAGLPYTASFNPPITNNLIWLDLNGTTLSDTQKAAGAYKICPTGSPTTLANWVDFAASGLTQAQIIQMIITRNIKVDGTSIGFNANGELKTLGGGGGLPAGVTISPTGIILGLTAGKHYHIHAECSTSIGVAGEGFAKCLRIGTATGTAVGASVGLLHYINDQATTGLNGIAYADAVINLHLRSNATGSICDVHGMGLHGKADSAAYPFVELSHAATNALINNLPAQATYSFALSADQNSSLVGFTKIFSIAEEA